MISYNNFLLELVRNQKNIKWYIKKLLIEVKKLEPKRFSYNIDLHKFNINFSTNFESNISPEIDFNDGDLNIKENVINYINYYLYIKDLYIGQVKPTRYVYHTSFNKYDDETIKIINKWWYPNMHNHYKGKDMIMTCDSVPIETLTDNTNEYR